MHPSSTSETLLRRLREPADKRAWDRFVEIYTPLLYHWAYRAGYAEADAADLVQDVLLLLLRKLPDFDYDREGSFRGWLRTVACNCWRNRRRRVEPAMTQADLDQIAVPDAAETFWRQEYLRHLMRRALELAQRDFEETTWKACWGCVVEGKTAAEVGHELGLSPGAVYVARSRVLRHLRQELEGMLD